MHRSLSYISSTNSDPPSNISMDSGADHWIFLSYEKDGHVTPKRPFITNFKQFLSNWNNNFRHNYGSGRGGCGYRGGRGGCGGYYCNRPGVSKGKDGEPDTLSTKQSETGNRTVQPPSNKADKSRKAQKSGNYQRMEIGQLPPERMNSVRDKMH